MSEDKALRRARAKLSKALDENNELEAIELLVELRRYEPDNARWPHKQGELLRQLGHTAQAAHVFEKAALLYAKQGYIARAAAMAKTVVELDPARIAILERIDPDAAQRLRTHRRLSRHLQVGFDDRPVEQLPLAATSPSLRVGPPAPPPIARPPVPQGQEPLRLTLPPMAAAPAHGPAVGRTGLSLPPMAAAPAPAVSQRPARSADGLSYQKLQPGRPLAPAPAVSQRPARSADGLSYQKLQPGRPLAPAPAVSQRPGRSADGLSYQKLQPGRPLAPAPAVSQRPGRSADGLSYQKLQPGRSLAPACEGSPSLPPQRAGQVAPSSEPQVALPEAGRSLAPQRSGRVAPPPPPQAALAQPAGAARSLAPERAGRELPPPLPAAAIQPQAVTLDRISLPPVLRSPSSIEPSATASLEELYGRAVRAVPLLEPDRAAPADETRLSERPAPSPERALAEQLLARSASRRSDAEVGLQHAEQLVARSAGHRSDAEVGLQHAEQLVSRGASRRSDAEVGLQHAEQLVSRGASPQSDAEVGLQHAEQLVSRGASPQSDAEAVPTSSLQSEDGSDAEVALALASLEPDEGLGGQMALSEIELAPRVAVPVLESQRPQPPTAATLAELPLFPLFAALPQPVLARIVAGSELISKRDGDYVLRHGDDGDALYGIVEGSVSLTVPGQPFELTLAEGDVFGESCLLEDAKSQLDVLVLGQLSALRIPRAVLLQGIEAHPPLAGLVLSLLTRRLLGNLLQISPLFQDLDAHGKAELARLFEVRRVAAGTQLSVSGKKMDGLYISLSGTLHVARDGATAWIAPPGSMLGQSCLLHHTPSSVDITAAVDMIVLRLPAARFAGLAMQQPTVLARMAELSTADVVRVML